MDAVTRVPAPVNEPVRQYQRAALTARWSRPGIKELTGQRADLTMTIGGRQVMGGGERVPVVAPHAFRRLLGEMATLPMRTWPQASRRPARPPLAGERCRSTTGRPVFLRAADLLAGRGGRH